MVLAKKKKKKPVDKLFDVLWFVIKYYVKGYDSTVDLFCIVSEYSFDNSVLRDGFTEVSHEGAFSVLRGPGHFINRK